MTLLHNPSQFPGCHFHLVYMIDAAVSIVIFPPLDTGL